MTCLEKYISEHRDENPDDVVKYNCPHFEGGIDIENPNYCTGGNSDLCRACWNRQIPGTENDEPHIRDSGARTEFSTGAVRDIQKGKGRCDLMPLDVVAECFALTVGGAMPQTQVFRNLTLFMENGAWMQLGYVLFEFCGCREWDFPTMFLEVSKHFEEGAEKYGENNWQKGLPVKCYINSAVRHYLKWLRGDNDEPHDRAFVWNIICAIWTCKHKPTLNDYVKLKPYDADEFLCELEED